jgi:ABC-2 type transport system ATP-binding protein
MASIEVQHLTKEYRFEAPVVDDISFRFEGTGAIGYLGPNGAGKTTTLKLLVGLLRPTSGRALLNDRDPASDRKAALWDVGAIIETPEPYPTMTVFDALNAVGELRGLGSEGIDDEIDRCITALRIPPLGRTVGGLSKGERQRVVLAAALIGDPKVLLLDEPTSGLDPEERVLVRTLLGELKRDHLILLSSHQMAEVADVCDELLILHRGRVLLRERLDQVDARIHSRQVDVDFAEPVDSLPLTRLRELAADVRPLSERRLRLTFDGSAERRTALLAECQRMGSVVRFTGATLALEEAYLEAIARAPAR